MIISACPHITATINPYRATDVNLISEFVTILTLNKTTANSVILSPKGEIMRNKKVKYVCEAAMIAAFYVVLTLICDAFGLSSLPVQIRFSEALTVLPAFMPSAVPGLFVGCLIANIITTGNLLDIVFGSLATLIAAFLSRVLGRKNRWLSILPPVVVNTLIIPLVLKFGLGFGPYLLLAAGVFAGEAVSCGVFGSFLIMSLKKYGFKKEK